MLQDQHVLSDTRRKQNCSHDRRGLLTIYLLIKSAENLGDRRVTNRHSHYPTHPFTNFVLRTSLDKSVDLVAIFDPSKVRGTADQVFTCREYFTEATSESRSANSAKIDDLTTRVYIL